MSTISVELFLVIIFDLIKSHMSKKIVLLAANMDAQKWNNLSFYKRFMLSRDINFLSQDTWRRGKFLIKNVSLVTKDFFRHGRNFSRLLIGTREALSGIIQIDILNMTLTTLSACYSTLTFRFLNLSLRETDFHIEN